MHGPKVLIFTARKRSLGQGNGFTPVCHSVHRRGDLLPPHRQTWGLGRPPQMQTPLGRPSGCRPPWVGQTPPGWADPSGLGRPPWMQTPLPLGVGQTPPDADPLGLGRPTRCRPPWGWADPPSDTVNKRAVRILLECILVRKLF